MMDPLGVAENVTNHKNNKTVLNVIYVLFVFFDVSNIVWIPPRSRVDNLP